MGKRLLSILCILSMLILWAMPAGAYAAPGEPENVPASTPDLSGDWITKGLSGIRVDNADDALSLLTGGVGEGVKALGPADTVPEYALKDTLAGKAGQGISYRFQQTYHGIPVYGMVRIVHTDANGYVEAISGHDDTVVAGMSLPTRPALTEPEARDAAIAAVAFQDPVFELTESELCYVMKPSVHSAALYHLAYRILLSGVDGVHGPFCRIVTVDAQTGGILRKEDGIAYGQHGTGSGYGVCGDYKTFPMLRCSDGSGWEMYDTKRYITCFDMINSSKSRDRDGGWNTEKQAAEVDGYCYTMDTYDFFKDTFGLRSFDGKGAVIRVYVHYGTNVADAFWNGSAFYYGDGDRNTLPWSGAHDIVAHEYTHAITDFTADFEPSALSGALDEAFSDIFGALAEDAPDDDSFYRIGESIRLDAPALRDMARPAHYGMPAHMDQYQHIGEEDNGGVHVNCAIPCKAFHTMGQSLSRE